MHSTRLINRGGAKSIPQAVWDKVSTDGTVIAEMGPQNLARSLEPVWPADQPHIPIEKIRDWFASYVYMPRLRDDATLDGALQRLVKDLAEPYVYASSFDEVAGTYGAALYVFLFGAILCGLLLWLGSDATGMAEAKDLFLATLPIGSGILAYWFAARGRSSSGDNDK